MAKLQVNQELLEVASADIVEDDTIIIKRTSDNIKIVPIDFDGMINSNDPFADMYEDSHPISANVGYTIDENWIIGWYLAKYFIHSTGEAFKVAMTAWISDTNYERATMFTRGVKDYLSHAPEQTHSITVAWNSPQLKDNTGTYSLSREITPRTNVKQSSDVSDPDWLQYSDMAQHEWFASLDIIVHNTPIQRVRHDVLIAQLCSMLKSVKANTLFVMRFPDARDWTVSEHHVLAFISTIFDIVNIWITPAGNRQVYIVARNSERPYGEVDTVRSSKEKKKGGALAPMKKISADTHKKLLALAVSGTNLFKLISKVNKDAMFALTEKVHKMQVNDPTETSTTWSQAFIDWFQ